MSTRVHTPTLASNPGWRLSLLGHKVLDLVASTASPKGALGKLPLIRYSLLFTVLVAGFQAVSSQLLPTATQSTSPSGPAARTVPAAAGLFGSAGPVAVADRTTRDLALIEAFRKPVAQLSLKLNVDPAVLTAMALLRNRDLPAGVSVDLAPLASALAAAAAQQHVVTPGEWLTAAASTFTDTASPEATLTHYLRRYGL